MHTGLWPITRPIVVGVLLALVSMAQASADPVEDCALVRNKTLRITACSEVIAGSAFTPSQKAAAYRIRGRARIDAGANVQGIKDLSLAIGLDGRDGAAHVARAQGRLALGDIDGAIEDLSSALAIAPGTVATLIARGHALLVKGQLDLAIGDLTEAIRRNPRSAVAHLHRGIALKRKGRLDDAIVDFTSALAINPSYALAYNNRGYAYEAKGRKTEAVADFWRALDLDRTLIGASAGLQRLGTNDGRDGRTELLIVEGRTLVEVNCSRCHAVGRGGDSPNPRAPEFHQLHRRHPSVALREPLSRGIAAVHDEMPQFHLTPDQLDRVIAYINSLSLGGAQ